MKRFYAFVLALVLMLSASYALAEGDLGVQIIGGEGAEIAPTSLDDMQVGTSYTLDGYAVVLPKEMKTVECFAQFGESGDYSVRRNTDAQHSHVFCHTQSNLNYNSWRYVDAGWMNSGETAEFVWLLMDVTNLQKSAVEFTEEVSVKVIYQDDYEFNGWVRQIVYDHMEAVNGDRGLSHLSEEREKYPNEIVMNPAKVEPIEMMYTGTYAFGCTLPNYVIADKKSPLRMEIQLGGNDLTYHIYR